jgi:hypothetical protein
MLGGGGEEGWFRDLLQVLRLGGVEDSEALGPRTPYALGLQELRSARVGLGMLASVNLHCLCG